MWLFQKIQKKHVVKFKTYSWLLKRQWTKNKKNIVIMSFAKESPLNILHSEIWKSFPWFSEPNVIR